MSAIFCLNTALGGGIVAPPWRCSDSWEAKFSGQTSHGTMKVTQILALSGHSIAPGLPMLSPLSYRFLTTKWFMILRSPAENENAWARFLASARNDNACHLERSYRAFSKILFSKEYAKVTKNLSQKVM